MFYTPCSKILNMGANMDLNSSDIAQLVSKNAKNMVLEPWEKKVENGTNVVSKVSENTLIC